MKRRGGAAAIVAVTLWAAWPGLSPEVAPDFAPPRRIAAGAETAAPPRLSSALINAPEPPRVHAASLAELPDGRLFAVWFGGSREGSADVRIYGAVGEPDEHGAVRWHAPECIVSTAQAARAADRLRWVRKLGNPVVFATPTGETWVIYVGATLGGWAASRLNLLRLPGKTASSRHATSRPLTSSPFFNMSTLVKGPPVFFDNGDIGMPVYHEMAGKFAELLVLSPTGAVRRKIRLDHGRRTLQPVLLVEDARHAIALMRDARGDPPRVWRSETADAGRHWSAPETTALPNPNSALGALRLEDGRLLAVANDTEDERLRLSLLVSEDRGHHWRVIHRFEDKQAQRGKPLTKAAFRAQLEADIAALGPARPAVERIAANVMRNACRHADACAWQYDYPYLIRAAGGDFHLLYTWNRAFIRHVRFNTAWLRARLEAMP
ncbi:MAG: exo-alpha-sialidase [Azoarcus sp.]|jgi:predicted neuraminidase|nr:exo-alpha-sialidase [Azoarcus sp.]